MLKRKFTTYLQSFLQREKHKILLINGARQIGKSFLIRYVGQQLFTHYVEIDLRADKENLGHFAKVHSTEDFYLQLGILYGNKLGSKEDTLIFLDEIQCYPHLLTMLKFLNQESRYTYVASGSQLGVALSESTSVPLGSVEIQQMYPLDFEEFLWAMGCGTEAIGVMRNQFQQNLPLDETTHEYMLKMFRYYLLTGGLPDAVNIFVDNKNITAIRTLQQNIHNLYGIDASQYDLERKLKIRRIYDMIPSTLENRKKRIVYQNIENKKGKDRSDYADEFDYLIHSGIALEVKAISNPRFPLLESQSKNLVKLYLNDVGLLTQLLFDRNANAILEDEHSINMGTVYESVVAQELHAHAHRLHYYDNKKNGEVDFLIDDYGTLSVLPIEVKSGKNYKEHSAISHFISTPDYHIQKGIVLNNQRDIRQVDKIFYMPIYYVMFL